MRTLQKRGIGADACLLSDDSGRIFRTGMLEKLLILFLAKLANYVAGGESG